MYQIWLLPRLFVRLVQMTIMWFYLLVQMNTELEMDSNKKQITVFVMCLEAEVVHWSAHIWSTMKTPAYYNSILLMAAIHQLINSLTFFFHMGAAEQKQWWWRTMGVNSTCIFYLLRYIAETSPPYWLWLVCRNSNCANKLKIKFSRPKNIPSRDWRWE